ncbi:MAG: hypothetical protein ABH879_01330 [archaeon]
MVRYADIPDFNPQTPGFNFHTAREGDLLVDNGQVYRCVPRESVKVDDIYVFGPNAIVPYELDLEDVEGRLRHVIPMGGPLESSIHRRLRRWTVPVAERETGYVIDGIVNKHGGPKRDSERRVRHALYDEVIPEDGRDPYGGIFYSFLEGALEEMEDAGCRTVLVLACNGPGLDLPVLEGSGNLRIIYKKEIVYSEEVIDKLTYDGPRDQWKHIVRQWGPWFVGRF